MTPPTVPCPGCAAPMGLEEEVCPACRRPRDAFEIEEGRRSLLAAVQRRRRRPVYAALWLAAAGAAYGLYLERVPLAARLARERARFSADMELASDPSKRPGGAAPRTEWGRRLISALDPGRGARETATVAMPAASASPAAPAAPAARRRAAQMPEPAPASGDLRKLYGVVYEFDTALAVPGAEVHLIAPGSIAGMSATTDADGRWSMEVNRSIPNDGRTVLTVRVGGRPVRVINESDPPYMTRTPAMLKQDLAAMRDYDERPASLDYDDRMESVRVNLVVVPPPR